jgi:hypothetical protein
VDSFLRSKGIRFLGAAKAAWRQLLEGRLDGGVALVRTLLGRRGRFARR